MPSRTWPVFLLGLFTLLLLICFPGLLLLMRTEENFASIRAVQRQYESGVRTINAVNTRIINGSLLVREFLLDSSPLKGPMYRKQFEQNRTELAALLVTLRTTVQPSDHASFERLYADFQSYSADVLPVFEWTVEERRAKATWFLREQQRLRRDSLLATAGHLAELHQGNYRRQQLNLDQNRETFRGYLKRLVLVATLLGIAVAAATVFRIYLLERDSSRQQGETERARAELQALSHELLRAQESERRSLSRELHDQVGQTLTALRMELGAIERLRDTDRSRFSEHLDEAKTLAERSLRTVRDIAAELRPSLLDDLGLGPALELETRDFTRRTGTTVALELSSKVDELPESYRICLFRVVQEALTNCTRHADASAVRITATQAEEHLLLSIEDNGNGCDPRQLQRGGIGLRGLQERISELNGTVAFQTAPGRGLQIHIQLPLMPTEVSS